MVKYAQVSPLCATRVRYNGPECSLAELQGTLGGSILCLHNSNCTGLWSAQLVGEHARGHRCTVVAAPADQHHPAQGNVSACNMSAVQHCGRGHPSTPQLTNVWRTCYAFVFKQRAHAQGLNKQVLCERCCVADR